MRMLWLLNKFNIIFACSNRQNETRCEIFVHGESVANVTDTDYANELKTWWGCDDFEAPNPGVHHLCLCGNCRFPEKCEVIKIKLPKVTLPIQYIGMQSRKSELRFRPSWLYHRNRVSVDHLCNTTAITMIIMATHTQRIYLFWSVVYNYFICAAPAMPISAKTLKEKQ